MTQTLERKTEKIIKGWTSHLRTAQDLKVTREEQKPVVRESTEMLFGLRIVEYSAPDKYEESDFGSAFEIPNVNRDIQAAIGVDDNWTLYFTLDQIRGERGFGGILSQSAQEKQDRQFDLFNSPLFANELTSLFVTQTIPIDCGMCSSLTYKIVNPALEKNKELNFAMGVARREIREARDRLKRQIPSSIYAVHPFTTALESLLSESEKALRVTKVEPATWYYRREETKEEQRTRTSAFLDLIARYKKA